MFLFLVNASHALTLVSRLIALELPFHASFLTVGRTFRESGSTILPALEECRRNEFHSHRPKPLFMPLMSMIVLIRTWFPETYPCLSESEIA